MLSAAFVLAGVVLLQVTSAVQVKAIDRVGDLPIQNKFISPDGFSRNTVLAGGSFPGPTIKSGDPWSQLQLTVKNQLNDSSMPLPTTVHWHGLNQKGTVYEDGTAGVTQCPIVPKSQFTYSFNPNGQAGTYWYHSHYSTQYCDGLRGPIVIQDPADPHLHLYDVDDPDKTVITLADWYHKPSLQYVQLDPPDATLINGLGRAWLNTKLSPLAVVTVTRNLRYRFRLVSLSCDPAFLFSIDKHMMTVIEADGVSHQPVAVDSLKIYAGQRYSVVMTANQPTDNYWIRVKPVSQTIDINPALNTLDPFANATNSAILRYSGAKAADPATRNITLVNTLVDTKLQPLVNPAAPGPPDANAPDVYKLNIDFGFTGTGFNVNGKTDTLPDVPVLLQILRGADAASLLPQGSYFSLPKNKVVQLSLPAGPAAPTVDHPMHLHGHTFSVIRGAGQTGYNFNNPPRRDVVNMGQPGDNVTIRFFTDNSGPWFLHCHIDWHLAAGFATVFVEDTPAAIKTNTHPPSSWGSLCTAWDQFNAAHKA